MFYLKIISILILLFNSHLVSAKWEAISKIDQMTDQKSFYIVNSTKRERIFIYKSSAISYGVGFEIKKGNFIQIHYEPKSFVIRIDSHPSIEKDMSSWEPKKAYFTLQLEEMDKLVKGKILKIQYHTSKNSKYIATFSLKGIRNIIKKGLPSYRTKKQRELIEMRLIEKEQKLNQQRELEIQQKMKMEAKKNCPQIWFKYNQLNSTKPWMGCNGQYSFNVESNEEEEEF